MLKYFFTIFSTLVLVGCSTEKHTPLNKETTLSIIKPDAVQSNHIGDIIRQFESNNLRIAGMKMVQLDRTQASNFYNEHRDRPFYPELVKFMISGPVILMVLEGDNAVARNREIMGVTNPEKAEEGTIRRRFARSISENAVHGSDSIASAQREVAFFFEPDELSERFID